MFLIFQYLYFLQKSIFHYRTCNVSFKLMTVSECERSCHLYGGLSNWTSSKYMKALPAGGESALLLSLRDAGTFCRFHVLGVLVVLMNLNSHIY